MTNPSQIDQLDECIEALLTGRDCVAAADTPLRELLSVAEGLQTLPGTDFKARLKADLLEAAESLGDADLNGMVSGPRISVETRCDFHRPADSEILPSLFGSGVGAYPVHRGSFMVSALAHTAALALLITVGILAGQRAKDIPRVSSVLVTEISPYILPASPDRAGGGGGGGDHSILQASKGNPPRFAGEQLTPPAIVVQNEAPKLTGEPTVVGPPELSFPQTQMGDPLARVLGPLSNGTGSGGGIGSGSDGGVGAGRGPGVGPGYGGGIGDGPYLVGHGVSAPRTIYDPEPDYSEEARLAKYQGMVVLRVVVGSDGRPQDVRVARTLGMGLDEKATEAVRQWRFEPSYLDGRAVAVVVDVQVNFRLY